MDSKLSELLSREEVEAGSGNGIFQGLGGLCMSEPQMAAGVEGARRRKSSDPGELDSNLFNLCHLGQIYLLRGEIWMDIPAS